MPNSNSPWGSSGGSNGGGKNPWGSSGGGNRGGGGKRPPTQDLDNVIKGFKNAFGNGGKGGGKGGKPSGGGVPRFGFPAIAIGLGLLYMASTCVYQIDQSERAVVLRFGEYHRTSPSGLNFKLPVPFETIIKRNTENAQKIDIGNSHSESYMLTGDENIVSIDFTVLWRINNLSDHLFEVQGAPQAVRDVAESAMREIIGKNNLEDIITTERLQITRDVKALMQTTLDEYHAGVIIDEVQLQEALVPDPVLDSFRDVKNAEQDAETVVNQAHTYENQVVPEAEGDAAKIIQDAQAYKGKVVAEATGEAERFRLVYQEYKAAPRVTRQRLYLEAMEAVYENADKIIMDEGAGGGVVPYLSLDELKRNGRSQ